MTIRKILATLALILSPAAAYCESNTDALRQRADELHAAGKNDSAVIIAGQAMEAARHSRDTVAMIGVNSSMGVYLRTMGKIDEAMKHYDEAMKMCTTESFKRNADEDARQEAAALYLNMATLHIDMQHKEQAAYYARLTAEWARRCTDKAFKAQVLTQDGLIFLMCGDNKGAAALLAEGYQYSLELEQHAPALNAAAYMVAVADRMGDANAEALWRKRSTELAARTDDTMALVAYYQILCSIEVNHKRWHNALELFDKILSTKGVESMPFVVYDCYNNMHEAWAALGEWRKAYETQGKAVALKDSLFEADKAESLRQLDAKYKAAEKELELARSESELARTRMYLAVTALVVLACAVLIYTYVQRQRRKAREREAEFARLKADTDRRLTRRYIDGLESERSRLAKELHDGVCNDLYTVELYLGGTDNGAHDDGTGRAEKLKGMINECREQARRISHELMPPEFNYADIRLVLEDYLMRTAEASGIDISFDATPDGADWSRLADTTALELYRITQEAVNNAVKHSGATAIEVTLDESDGTLTLAITDNGTYAGAQGAGIGRRTMRQRAEAAGGRLTTETTAGKTTVRLTVNHG